MPTSSIFSSIVINDPEQAERFISALEASEQALSRKEQAASDISVTRDLNEISKLMSKQFPEM